MTHGVAFFLKNGRHRFEGNGSGLESQWGKELADGYTGQAPGTGLAGGVNLEIVKE